METIAAAQTQENTSHLTPSDDRFGTFRELNNSIDVLLAWAPSASLKNVTNPIAKFVERHWEEYEVIFKFFKSCRKLAYRSSINLLII